MFYVMQIMRSHGLWQLFYESAERWRPVLWIGYTTISTNKLMQLFGFGADRNQWEQLSGSMDRQLVLIHVTLIIWTLYVEVHVIHSARCQQPNSTGKWSICLWGGNGTIPIKSTYEIAPLAASLLIGSAGHLISPSQGPSLMLCHSNSSSQSLL